MLYALMCKATKGVSHQEAFVETAECCGLRAGLLDCEMMCKIPKGNDCCSLGLGTRRDTVHVGVLSSEKGFLATFFVRRFLWAATCMS